MGTVTKSIGTSARDYSTIAAWEAALPANLVTDGNAQVGECYNDSEFTITSRIVIDGQTTDATNSITLKCAAGHSFRDHASVRTNALKYNVANGVGIRKTNRYDHTFEVKDNYVTLDGLQIATPSATDDGAALWVEACNNLVFKNLLLQARPSLTNEGVLQLYQGVDSVLVQNCAIISVTSASKSGVYFHSNATTGVVDVTNCTVVRCSDKTIGNSAFHSQYTGTAKPRIRNCAAFGFTNFFNNSANFHTGCDYNASDTTIPTGSNNQASKTYSSTQPFVSAASTSIDFRVTSSSDSGAALIDKGTTLTDGTPDITNTTRPSGSAYDIGCWEVVAASDLATKPVNVNQAVNRSYSY